MNTKSETENEPGRPKQTKVYSCESHSIEMTEYEIGAQTMTCLSRATVNTEASFQGKKKADGPWATSLLGWDFPPQNGGRDEEWKRLRRTFKEQGNADTEFLRISCPKARPSGWYWSFLT